MTIKGYSGAAKVQKCDVEEIFEDRLILNFFSSKDLELMKIARSPKIWAP